MPAVTTSGQSADNIQVEALPLIADGANTAAEAATVAAAGAGGAVGAAAATAAGAGPDAVSAAITAAMSPWAAELAACEARATALASETASTDSTCSATLEAEDGQAAATISAAVPGPGAQTPDTGRVQPTSYTSGGLPEGPWGVGGDQEWELDVWGTPQPVWPDPDPGGAGPGPNVSGGVAPI
ncbi:hypothetical protein [Mycolicibacterium goodii]|uniref:Uncharacterized protein n=1 Tax=Mycolicibacterium goodii TaxID=134601 RepID=A0ABS6HV95_MYCGD|nr:hypothetical protein [Mycolicibacterium goodii]MBU8826500.1 hypothetical protein [Mycolicibacterium goodii]